MSKVLGVKQFKDLIQRGKVVIDANVLLQAYQYKGITFEKIITQLELLAKVGRLVIPSNIVKEFNRNRPNLIRDMENSLQQIIDNVSETLLLQAKNIPPTKALINYAPYFSEAHEFKDAKNAKDEIVSRVEAYRDSLIKLHSNVLTLFEYDPYLERIESIISQCQYSPSPPHDEEALVQEAERRVTLKIPPGYKDKAKEAKGGDPYGDYRLWADIMTINYDVLLITNDTKPDWFLKGSGGKTLELKVELLEEFTNRTGCSIKAAVSKILNDFDNYFTELKLKILDSVNDISYQTFYDNYEAISRTLISHFDTRNVFNHVGHDASYLDADYVRNLKVSHAEMALSYVTGGITEDELKESFDMSVYMLEEFWDSRFERHF